MHSLGTDKWMAPANCKLATILKEGWCEEIASSNPPVLYAQMFCWQWTVDSFLWMCFNICYTMEFELFWLFCIGIASHSFLAEWQYASTNQTMQVVNLHGWIVHVVQKCCKNAHWDKWCERRWDLIWLMNNAFAMWICASKTWLQQCDLDPKMDQHSAFTSKKCCPMADLNAGCILPPDEPRCTNVSSPSTQRICCSLSSWATRRLELSTRQSPLSARELPGRRPLSDRAPSAACARP